MKRRASGNPGPIAQILTRLSFTIGELAQLVGVHATTVHRWLIGCGADTMDQLSACIITHLANHSAGLSPAARDAWGLEIRQALCLGGTLRGLAVALAPLLAAYQASKPRS